jgi:hypothetical protein
VESKNYYSEVGRALVEVIRAYLTGSDHSDEHNVSEVWKPILRVDLSLWSA